MEGPSKRLPKRLEQELNNAPRYKPNGRPGSASKKGKPEIALKNAMNKNVEQAMFDEILGPLVNHNSRRPASTSSPIRSPSGKGGVGAVGGLLRPGSASKKSSEESKEDMAFLKGVYNGSSKEKGGNSPSSVKSTLESGKSGGDSSFTTSILSRLASVEKENKDLRNQLASTAAKVDNLEHENKKLSLILNFCVSL